MARPHGALGVAEPTRALTIPGYDDPSTGAFRAVVECADALRRRRAPVLGRMAGLQSSNLAQAQAVQAAQVQQQMAASSQVRSGLDRV